MKLLKCNKCGDIFNIKLNVKSCSCGESSGCYDDNLNAHYSGDCLPLGITNNSFKIAEVLQPDDGDGKEFTAFVIPKNCETFKKIK